MPKISFVTEDNKLYGPCNATWEKALDETQTSFILFTDHIGSIFTTMKL